MSNDWKDYPFSVFSAALSSAMGIGIGFILALFAGGMIGFYGHGATMGDASDGLFFLYLFYIFPVHLLANLGRISGLLAALASIVLLILYFKWDNLKLEILLLYALSVGLCVFQSIGLAQDSLADMPWARFSIGCAAGNCEDLAIRGIEFLWWNIQKRK